MVQAFFQSLWNMCALLHITPRGFGRGAATLEKQGQQLPDRACIAYRLHVLWCISPGSVCDTAGLIGTVFFTPFLDFFLTFNFFRFLKEQ